MKANTTDTNIWRIHGGEDGEADDLFLNKQCIAVGWQKMGNLSALKPDFDAFKARLAEVYPETKARAIPSKASVLFRLVHEMKSGDLVVYPSKPDRQIHLGRVQGDYRYDPKTDTGYPDVRPVKWLQAVPRTQFSQGALYEINVPLTLILVKNHPDEFRTAAEGKPLPLTPVVQDETVIAVARDIEETTRDFVLKQLAQELKGHPLAHFVAHLLNTMGYRTRVLPPGPDGGIDIEAHKDELGFEPPKIKVQVKSGEGSISDSTVSALYGKVGAGEFGLFVTLGTFTPPAKNFAKSKSNLRLIDGEELVQLIFEHYDQFESRYKSLLPLRRVYVPEVIEGSEE